MTRRELRVLALGSAACFLVGHEGTRLHAQDTPSRREVSITAEDYQFSPARIEVNQDDLLKLVIRSADFAYGFTIDDYRVSRRVPAGGETTVEFRADRAGSFRFYSNLTNDPRHRDMRGALVVRDR